MGRCGNMCIFFYLSVFSFPKIVVSGLSKKPLPGASRFFRRKPQTQLFNSGSSPSQVQEERIRAATSTHPHGFSKAFTSLLHARAHTNYSLLWSSFGRFLSRSSVCIPCRVSSRGSVLKKKNGIIVLSQTLESSCQLTKTGGSLLLISCQCFSFYLVYSEMLLI